MSLKKIIKLPSQIYLKERLEYDATTGELTWRLLSENSSSLPMTLRGIRIFNSQRAGNTAGHIFKETSGSYAIQLRLDGKSYYAHRIIWKMVTGKDAELIDHEDGNRLNNKINNLRDVSNTINSRNCKLHCKNTSGHTGVSWSKTSNKWEAYIWDNSVKYNLGLFVSLEDAISAREEKEKELGYHPLHGKR